MTRSEMFAARHPGSQCYRSQALLLLVALLLPVIPLRAQQIDIPGPLGSETFGQSVAVLPNGNIVVTDPGLDGEFAVNVGAVYLYSPTGTPLSSFRGSTADDYVGSGGIHVLSNGNFVISSPAWDNASLVDAGAVTWVDGDTGLTGIVSLSNSLVGTTASDMVGSSGVTELSNGNYVVESPGWDFGTTTGAGAATWANGSTGLSGPVTPSNSLVGTSAYDFVGDEVIALSNGNYVVASFYWDYGAAQNAGAVTWANGSTGVSGLISTSNSLIRATSTDYLSSRVIPLSNGNYVVASPYWDNGPTLEVGAVTWGSGSTGRVGLVSTANSLVGTSAYDYVGTYVTALSNGNYVVGSHVWNNGITTNNAGAATWANGSIGLVGSVSADNSLIGSTAEDRVAAGSITALDNGNYVVKSIYWRNGGAAEAGATTWGNGSAGLVGVVSAANSLVGTAVNDRVGRLVVALRNGNYVVASADWNDGITADAGAATWANGSMGMAGIVSAANSLIGIRANDRIGQGVIALSNGNYVVASHFWSASGATTSVGAATWANGSVGLVDTVSASNSLVGTRINDQVGFIVTALSNGHYVVGSPNWDNGLVADTGAVTWASGNTGRAGPVTAINSLIGSIAGDQVGFGGIVPMSNGSYVISSRYWDNGFGVDAGAVSFGRGSSSLVGTIQASNSVRGATAGGGSGLTYAYDAARDQLVVGQPFSNLVSLFKGDQLFKNGFDP